MNISCATNKIAILTSTTKPHCTLFLFDFMCHIAIIGAGQLGSRHLQGLKSARLPMRIQVVDSSQAALDTARDRYEQIETNPQIQSIDYLTDMDQLDAEIDLVIIATGSKPRATILKELLSKKRVSYLLLEKVLFPDLKSYHTIHDLLQDKGLSGKTWINCTRHLFQGYQLLQKELQNYTGIITYEKNGSNWGLGCNTIHFIDHFAFLTGDTDIQPFDLSALDPEIQASKRPGYVEFTGTITSSTKRGNILHITSSSRDDVASQLIISTDQARYEIDETSDTITKNGQFWGNIGMKYQSQLTGLVAEQILQQGICALPSYTESARLHLTFLQPLVKFYNNSTGKNGDNCPIT